MRRIVLLLLLVVFLCGCLQSTQPAASTTLSSPSAADAVTSLPSETTTLYPSQPNPPASSTTLATSAATQAETTTLPQSSASVAIRNFAFTPSALTVAAGTTVTWVNEDSAPHTLKSDSFASGKLGRGDSFSFTFRETGAYTYVCGIHPSMKGKIIVE